MKEDTLLLMRNFRNDIRNKLTKEEQTTLDYLLDSLTYEKYSTDMNLSEYIGRYDVILVDGTEIKEVRFDMDYFVSEKDFEHPQKVVVDHKGKEYYYIQEELVKYIRRYN